MPTPVGRLATAHIRLHVVAQPVRRAPLPRCTQFPRLNDRRAYLVTGEPLLIALQLQVLRCTVQLPYPVCVPSQALDACGKIRVLFPAMIG